MARVFVSYRRADGRMAVDWIAERLQGVGVAKDVQAAFHDGGLQGGDDFAAALIGELRQCDLVIAVIGPNWEGRKEHGPSRIKDSEDWVVKELATANELGARVVPVLVDGAQLPVAADVHESIAWLRGRHALRFERAADLDKIVAEIRGYLRELDEAEATRDGLDKEIVVPDLLPTRKLAPLLVFGGLVGLLVAYRSAFDEVGDGPLEIGSTSGYGWYSVLLLAYGVFGGVAAPVGVLITRRLISHSVTRWKELLVAAVMVAAVPVLMILSSGGSHLILAETGISSGEIRAYGNLIAISLAVAAWAYGIGAPMFAVPRAEEHELGKRVMHLALMRDAERWGIIIAATVLSIGTGVSVALAAAGDQWEAANSVASELREHEFDELTLISLPLVMTALLVVGHRWAVSAMAETHVTIDRRLQALAEPYRSHGVGRMAAAPFADGGWAFRVLLAMPFVVATVGVLIYRLG